MDQFGAGARLDARGFGFARGDAGRAAVQRRAIGFDRGQLAGHGAFGHHDVAGNPTGARGQGQRGAVVARGVGHHAACGMGLVEGKHRVAGAAELERARALQVFGLEIQLAAGLLVDRGHAQDGGDVRMRRDPGGRGQDVGRVGQGLVGHGGSGWRTRHALSLADPDKRVQA